MPSLTDDALQAREQQVFAVLRELLPRLGPQGLTMDKVAAKVDFSKGTLYNHFRSVEDLLLAFLTAEFKVHQGWFERAALFRGRARERFLALALAAQLADQELGCDDLPPSFIADDQVFAKASAETRERFQEAHRTTFSIFTGVVRDGIAAGDLPSTVSPALVSTAGWSLFMGAAELYRARLIFVGEPPEAFGAATQQMFLHLLDGFGWKPLSTEHDYSATIRRVLQEVFPEEAHKLGLLGGSAR
jgi:AcrR family transcriptional regulator